MKLKRRIFFFFTTLYIVFAFMIGQVNRAETAKQRQVDNVYSQLQKEQRKSDSLRLELQRYKKLSRKFKDSISDMVTFTPCNVKRFISYYEILHPEIVFKQTQLETGYFSSKIFNENNNLFGMKNPSSRATTSTGSINGHAQYENYIESIKDYKIFQDYYYDQNHSYLDFLLNVGYAEDSLYINKLKTKLNDTIRRIDCE